MEDRQTVFNNGGFSGLKFEYHKLVSVASVRLLSYTRCVERAQACILVRHELCPHASMRLDTAA